ncbi:PKD domain-containing protein [Fulvivirga lutea]|uniref:PKD domain-containing protein n=1 Tax=Fulvivirga lutea TaxID=2810512 RepID=A0A975A1L5_9BACT|nr:PKD domain-containing protein [Fulvivirga lutea]QSE98451.1 PKD domain-containing protein [Fulvivirga lutea]
MTINLSENILNLTSTLLLSLVVLNSYGQSVLDVTVNNSVCIEQQLNIENNSTGFTNYFWDFCIGDFNEEPIINSSSITGMNFGSGIELVEDQGNWFGFVLDRGAGFEVFRLDFGDSPLNDPIVTELNLTDGLFLKPPDDISVLKFNNVWHAVIGYRETGGEIIRLDFGPSLTNNNPVEINLGNFGYTTNAIRNVQLIDQSGDLVLMLAPNTGFSFWRINYGDSFDNEIDILTDVIKTTAPEADLNRLMGFDIKIINGDYILHCVTINAAKIMRLNFGSSLMNTPTWDAIYNFTGPSNSHDIDLVRDGSNFYGYVSNSSQSPKVFNFGDLTAVQQPAEISYSATIPTIDAIDVFRFDGRSFIYGVNNSVFNRIEHYYNCPVNLQTNAENEPEIFYNEEGSYEISLECTAPEGVSNFTETITVSPDIAPTISFANQTICQSSPIQFSSTTDGTGLTYTWDFGDGSPTSGDANPTHSYASAGEYEVKLSIEDGTCGNFTKQTITVYPEPAPDFTIPSGNICTNQNYLFTNDTPGNFDGLISYTWQLDGETVSTDEDLGLLFTSGGTKELKLIASIPGCDVEIAKNLTDIKEGSLSEFVFDDACIGELVQFTNQSIGAITDFNWDFGNGFSSTLENPQLEFADAGTFEVTLELTNADGCVTSDQQLITIHPLPEVNFESDLSCENLPTQFNDLSSVTLDNLNSWSWNFDDGSEPVTSQNTSHVFSENDNYDVKLIVGTTFGCLDSLTQTITVLEAPEAEFSFDKLCEDVVINFSDESIPLADEAITNWAWNIGGVFRGQQNPSYTFEEPIDYPVSLTITSENLCTSTIEKVISIPPSPSPSFIVEDNCTNELTRLIDVTEISGDEITSWSWTYDEQQLGTESSVENLFSDSGTYLVSMNLLTANGCEYEVSQNVEVFQAPQASFSPSTTFGAPELEVDFVNNSTGAITYRWDFMDGNTSEAINPTNNFTSIGEYDVQLIAINEQDCRDTVSQRISVLEPTLDLEITSLMLVERPNGDAISLTISNSGSIRHDSLLVTLDLGGEASFQQILRSELLPQETITRQLELGLTNRRLNYLCATVQSFYAIEEENSDNNNSCITYNNANLVTSLPYPNPSNGIVTIDLITTEEADVQIQIVNSQGHLISSFSDVKPRGNNNLVLDLSELSGGTYLIRLKLLGTEKLYRVMISN